MQEHELPSTVVGFQGPYTRHDVTVSGWRVPFLTAALRADDSVRVLLDERIGIDLSPAEADKLIPFIADAIAVALGYGAHPWESLTELPERTPHPAPRRVATVVLG